MQLEQLLDPAAIPDSFGIFTDFIRADEATATGGAVTFTVIATGTAATDALNGGSLRISGQATTTASGGNIQSAAAHIIADGKFLGFKCRAKLNESTSTNVATLSTLLLGLFPTDTSLLASVPDDCIYFTKPTAGTAIYAKVRVGGVEVFTSTLANVADKSFHHYGIGVIPNGATSTIDFSIDGVLVARATGLTMEANTVVLAASAEFQSGDNTGTKWVDIDYIGSVQKR
jgi:hypothetical protein